MITENVRNQLTKTNILFLILKLLKYKSRIPRPTYMERFSGRNSNP